MNIHSDLFTYDNDDFDNDDFDVSPYDDDDVIELFDVDGNAAMLDDEISLARIAALANDDVVMFIETFLSS